MTHRNPVIDRYRIKFLGDAAGLFDLPRHQLPQIFQVNVTGHKLGKGIGNGDDRLAEVAILDAGGPPQGASARHVAAVGGGAGTIVRHKEAPQRLENGIECSGKTA